jgi:drug/metabolite transporter (DMT)-like permease
MALGAFWFSLMSLAVKLVGRRLPSSEVVLVRGIFTLILSIAMLRHARVGLWGTQKFLLTLRGVFGWAALSCYYFSLVHLPLGEATLIQYSNPVFVAVLAALVLGEAIGLAEVLCLLASLGGVLLITRPAVLFGGDAAAIPPSQVAIALGGALFSAAGYTVVRRIGTTEHRGVLVFYLPLVTIPLTLPFISSAWSWPNAREWLLLVAIGLTTQLGQSYMTRGLQLERASRATAVSYLQIVFAAAWGAVVLGELPDEWTVAGAVVITGSTLLVSRLHRENPKK